MSLPPREGWSQGLKARLPLPSWQVQRLSVMRWETGHNQGRDVEEESLAEDTGKGWVSL